MCNTEQQKEKIAEWIFQAIREYYMKKCTFPNDKLHHPELAGKPMAVGGDPEARHGIVLSANYIAKRAGVKTGMALWQARQVCPEIIFVPPRMDLYLRFPEWHRRFTVNTRIREDLCIKIRYWHS